MHSDKELETIEIIDNHLENFITDDELIVFHEKESKDNHIDVYWIKPNLEYRPYSILMTCGMSRFSMKVPDGLEEKQFIELVMLLPAEWNLENMTQKDEKITWPITHLKSIAKIPVKDNSWIGYGHTITWSTHQNECFPGTQFNSSIILPSMTLPESFTRIESHKKVIKIYSVVPLYPEELDFKLKNDADSLIDKFNETNVEEILNINRINCCE